MLSKNEIKDIQSLYLKKHREERGLFVAEGPKIVGELLAIAPENALTIVATDEWHTELPTGSAKIYKVDQSMLERVSGMKSAHLVVAVFRQFPQKAPAEKGFMLYLDAIQDPGNLGTIIRIADWFGIKDIVCGKGCADMYNPKVVQSTMASIARVNVYYDLNDEWLQKIQLPLFAASLDGKPLHEFGKKAEGILMIGNESKGLRPELLSLADERITIPRKGEAESLNAAVATGILLSHLLG